MSNITNNMQITIKKGHDSFTVSNRKRLFMLNAMKLQYSNLTIIVICYELISFELTKCPSSTGPEEILMILQTSPMFPAITQNAEDCSYSMVGVQWNLRYACFVKRQDDQYFSELGSKHPLLLHHFCSILESCVALE